MDTLHAFEVVGEVLVRKSGNRSSVVRCMSIKTLGMLLNDEDGTRPIVVQVADIQSGFTHVAFPTWFRSWNRSIHDVHENLYGSGSGSWTGQFFEVAIEWNAFLNLRLGNPIPSGGEHIVAAKINGLWVEAIHDFEQRRPTLPRQRMSGS